MFANSTDANAFIFANLTGEPQVRKPAAISILISFSLSLSAKSINLRNPFSAQEQIQSVFLVSQSLIGKNDRYRRILIKTLFEAPRGSHEID